MCGLVGIFSSDFSMKHKDVLSTLLFLDTFRGKDSTGVAAVRHNTDTAILKSTIPGYEFVEGPKLEHHLRLNDFCWIGHNRFGTVGKNIKTNAHPFEVTDKDGGCIVVGAHNGTLKNKHALTDHHKFGTDSEALFNEIALNGIDEAIGKIEGAWAITYYDHNEEELRILRNKERPLFYAYEKGKKTLIWASEIWMIRVATSRHNVEIEDDKIFTFLEDTLYKFPAPEKNKQELTCERKGGLVGKTPPFFRHWSDERGTTTFGDSNIRSIHQHKNELGAPTPPQSETTTTSQGSRAIGFQANRQLIQQTSSSLETDNTESGTLTTNSGETQQTESVNSSNVLSSSFVRKTVRDIKTAKQYKGYAGFLLTRKELLDQLANGCAFCERQFIHFTDKFGWLDHGKPVCNNCLLGSHDVKNLEPGLSVSVH